MKNNKFLSIIIPIYNNPRDVLDLLNSIKIFDRNNLEIIIIDDGSNPKLQYKFNKFNIKYFYIKNSGPAFARNFECV